MGFKLTRDDVAVCPPTGATNDDAASSDGGLSLSCELLVVGGTTHSGRGSGRGRKTGWSTLDRPDIQSASRTTLGPSDCKLGLTE